MLRYPNRTGEVGTYSAGSVSLSGQALSGMRTFAASAAAGRIEDGDTVGLAIRSISDASLWQVWQAEYDAGTDTLTATLIEDESGSELAADALVEVTACITDGILRGFTWEAASYDYGPPVWVPTEDPPDVEWLPMDGHWAIIAAGNNGWLTPDSATAALRPATISVDVYVPVGADLVEAETDAGFVLTYGGGYVEAYIGSGVVEGWNTVTGTVTGQTGDIDGLGLFAFQDDRLGYRYRNIVLTE